MNYHNAVHNATTPQDLKLIGWIALQDQTLSAEQLRLISKNLCARLAVLQKEIKK